MASGAHRDVELQRNLSLEDVTPVHSSKALAVRSTNHWVSRNGTTGRVDNRLRIDRDRQLLRRLGLVRMCCRPQTLDDDRVGARPPRCARDEAALRQMKPDRQDPSTPPGGYLFQV